MGRNLYARIRQSRPEADISAVGRTPPRSPWDPPGPVLDISRPELLLDLGKPYEVIFHLAAALPFMPSGLTDSELLIQNISAAESILEACRVLRPRVLIVASTISVYPMGAAKVLTEDLAAEPDTAYGIAKLTAEHILNRARDYGVTVIRFRLSSVYGPGQRPVHMSSVLNRFVADVLDGRSPTVMGTGQRTQDFVYVADVVDCFHDRGRFERFRPIQFGFREIHDHVGTG